MPKILVVEDDRTVRQALVFLLGRDGYDAVGAEDLPNAEQALEQNGFDLIITDLLLRVGDGMKVSEIAQRKNPTTPIIIITAYPESDLGRTARQVFGENFFEKPLDMAELKKRVLALANKPQMKEEEQC